MNREIIFPEDVKFETVTQTLLKDKNGHLWRDDMEAHARNKNATVLRCETCKEPTRSNFHYLCDKCSREKSKKEYSKLKTTSEFPVMLDDDGEGKYFFHESDLMDYLEEEEIDINDCFIYGCEQRPFRELNYEWWEEQTDQDGEVPQALEDLIDEFNKKLKNIPGYWYHNKTRFVRTTK